MMKKLNNSGNMTVSLRITLLLLTISTICVPVLSQQTQVKGAYGGSKGIFVFLKAVTTINSDNIAYCSIERKEAGSNEWKTVEISRRPSNESDFARRLKAAILKMPYDVSFIEKKEPLIWKKYEETKSQDSLRMWFGMLPVQEALGVVYIDITAKPDVKYEYKIQQFDRDDKLLKTLFYLPATFPGEKSKWVVPYRSYRALEKQVTVTWGAPGTKLPPFSKIYRQEKNGGEWNLIEASIVNTSSKDSSFLSATDPSVTSDAIYRYKLVPMDMFGNPGKETESDLVAVYDFRKQAPVIQELKGENPDSLPGIIVSWTISRNDLVNSIRIYRSTNYDKGYTQIAEVPSTTSSYTDQTVEPNVKYYYQIKLTGPMGELSAPSSRVFAISDDRSKPLPPVILSAKGTTRGIQLSIKVTENNLSGVRIYRNSQDKTDLIPVSNLIPARNNMILWEDTTGISPVRFYGYAAKSENASHFQGDFSDTVYSKSAKQVITPEVIGLTADYHETYNQLYWTDMQFIEAPVAGYILYRKEMPSGSMTRLNDTVVSADKNSYADRSIASGKSYSYSVVLVDGFGNKSNQCNPVLVRPPVISLKPPLNVAANSEENGIRISWGTVQSHTLKEFRIYRYTRGSKPIIAGSVPAGSIIEFFDKNVIKGQLYFYYVITIDNDGRQSNPSTEISIRKD
jgi:fibronectin type 3 domain-containing protein